MATDYEKALREQRTRPEMRRELAQAEFQSMNTALLVGQKQTIELLGDIRDRLADMREWLPSSE